MTKEIIRKVDLFKSIMEQHVIEYNFNRKYAYLAII